MELRFLQERLEEIAGDNTGHEVSERVEHFQNQLIIHRDQIDQLKHRIQVNLDQITTELRQSENFIQQTTVDDAAKIGLDYEQEEQFFKTLRHDFNRFAAEWM